MADDQETPFWRFSLSLYRQKGVPDACIALQDGSGVDVNVMLYGLWLASRGRALAVADMREIDKAVGTWRADVVVPLRAVRRILKEPQGPFATPATQAMRDRIKAVELEAERLQQQALHDLQPPEQWGSGGAQWRAAAQTNLSAYAQALGVEFDGAAQSAMLAGMDALAAAGKLEQ